MRIIRFNLRDRNYSMNNYLKAPYLLLFALFVCHACQKQNGPAPIPATLSVSPQIDTIGGIITITGSGFSTDINKDTVRFNDSTLGLVMTASATQLTVMVPAFTAKDRIFVKVGNQQWQTSQEFKIAPKFRPLAEAPGYPITVITGGSTTLADYTVSFNGATTAPASMFGSWLTVNVPVGATSGKITVNYKGQPYTSFTDFSVSPVGSVSALTSTGVFQLPTGMAIDGNGHLYVSDLQGGVIYRVDTSSGAITTYAGNGTFNYNGGSPLLSAGVYGALNLAFSPDGNLYAVNNWYDQIFKITPDSVTWLMPVGGPAANTVFSPAGIVFDGSGNFYVSSNQQIRKISPAGTVSILAGTGLQGQENGPAASASFGNPSALQMDGSGALYICDGTRVRMFSSGMVSTFAGGGGNGAFQDGVGTDAGFLGTRDMVRDPRNGNFYVTDPGDHVIRMITPEGVVTTIAGKIGQQGNQNGVGSAALFEGPWGITMDKNGVLYVSDGSYGNSNIRKIVLR
jgi:sugar lactone lactonase YvrE